jgi:hypothetical protein
MKILNICKLGLVFSLLSATSAFAAEEFNIVTKSKDNEMNNQMMTMKLSEAETLNDSTFWQMVNHHFKIMEKGYTLQSEYWEDKRDYPIDFSEPAYQGLLKRVKDSPSVLTLVLEVTKK